MTLKRLMSLDTLSSSILNVMVLYPKVLNGSKSVPRGSDRTASGRFTIPANKPIQTIFILSVQKSFMIYGLIDYVRNLHFGTQVSGNIRAVNLSERIGERTHRIVQFLNLRQTPVKFIFK